ncbi:MAG: MerR family transcriptional regulator [Deltaproteobacteria bacterium]|nr:MerR family transcriptional regulator [Deltaproteobacteria bacterium]
MVKLSIGDFSRISKLTVKTLRMYHERGLLIPAYVDETSGYRFYDERNWETARVIVQLRKFDFTLAEISQILDTVSSDGELMAELKAKQKAIIEKMERYKDISRSIDTILAQEEEINMSHINQFEIEEKQVDTILIAGYPMKGKYSDIGKGFGVLGKKMGRFINGKAIGLYYDGEYKESNASFEACFPVRKGTSTKEISVRELPGGTVLSLVHKGPYTTLSNSYKRLLDHISQKGIESQLPTREIYSKGPDMIFKGNPNNYLTEIQIPINR